MKLADHVQIIKELIEKSFDKEFSKLGIMSSLKKDANTIPANLLKKREKFETILDSHEKEMGSYEKGRERAIDELTFTLFNRIAAIKVMEAKGLFPPIITKSEEHGNRSFGHKVWLEENPNMISADFEGIRDYIIYAFDNLGETLPLYNKKYPYALLPDVVSLNDIIEKFNSVESDTDIENNIWASDDILGWLYESYNLIKKKNFKDSGEKTEYDKVSLQSQFYTPRWVVEFLVNNSIGKMYMEMYPDSNIKHKFKIANLDTCTPKTPKPITEFKAIDPACGSGNFLLYIFDLLYELYLDQIDNYGLNIDIDEVPQLIVENNIFGVDLDDRAVQLAQLGLYIKVKSKKRRIKNLNFNVVSSAFFLPDYDKVSDIFNSQDFVYADQQDLINSMWEDLRHAYKYGSLIRINEHFDNKIQAIKEKYNKNLVQGNLFDTYAIQKHEQFEKELFANLELAVNKYAESSTDIFLCQKTVDAIKFLKILTTKYDVITANPPYTASADFGKDLKSFIDKNYKITDCKFNANLYGAFIKRGFELLTNNGYIGMIHPYTFMYLSDFNDVRKFILKNSNINILVELDIGGVFKDANLEPVMYILEKNSKNDIATIIDLKPFIGLSNKQEIFENLFEGYLNKSKDENVYILNQNKLKSIKNSPFLYWISENFREKFKDATLDDYIDIKQGCATGENDRFLRGFWEVAKETITETDNGSEHKKFVRYAKGGRFNRWAGNLWLVINWENDGKEIKDSVVERYPYLKGNYTFVVKNENFYFKEGITYSASGRGGYAFRYLPPNCMFDVGGSSMFTKNKNVNLMYVLAFLNSSLSFYIADCLNPTANIQVGDLKKVPFVLPDKNTQIIVGKIAQQNIDLTNNLLKYKLNEPNFKITAIEEYKNNKSWFDILHSFIKDYLGIKALILNNEAIVNDFIFKIFDLSEQDKSLVIQKQGVNIGNEPITKQAAYAFIEKYKNVLLNETIEHINSIAFRENIDEQSNIINNFDKILTSNNDLEEFSKNYKINPIDVWYIFANSKTLPIAFSKELGFEFITDLILDILNKDDDGIIPLVKNAGEKTLSELLESELIDKGYSLSQIGSIKQLIGKELNDYILNDFFKVLSDYLNPFRNLPKTPFVWHLTSGKEHAFECYVLIYKWSRDNLMRLRSVYVEHRERSLINRESDLANNNSAQAQTEKAQIKLQLEELQEFKNKIDDLLASGYDPKLDDGVAKNIAPLQKRKMLSYDVLNAGQLKKYLNADW